MAGVPTVGGDHKAPASKPKPAPVQPASRQHLSRSSKDTARAWSVAAAAEAEELRQEEARYTSAREKRGRAGVSPGGTTSKDNFVAGCAGGSSQGWSWPVSVDDAVDDADACANGLS